MVEFAVKAAVQDDAAAIAAFVRQEFGARPEIRGNVDLWTEGFAAGLLRRHFCLLAVEQDKVAGVLMTIKGDLALEGRPFLSDYLVVALASGSDHHQVRILDRLLDHAYKTRWEPEAILLLTVESRSDNAGVRWWTRMLKGSATIRELHAWGIVPTGVVAREVRARLRRG